jgi:hypothetical protein
MTQVRSLESRVPEISEHASAASTCCDPEKFSRDSRAPQGGGIGARGSRLASYAIALPLAGSGNNIATSAPDGIRISKPLN